MHLQRTRLWLLATFALVSLGFSFFLPRLCNLRPFFLHTVFWFLSANVIALLTLAAAPLRAMKRQVRAVLGLVAGAILAMALIFVLVPPAYRVLSDETNLLSTSLSLYRQGTLHNITEMWVGPGGPEVLSQGIATRPGLFPFLVSLLHFVFGYHAAHGFVVNFLVGVATLLCVVAIGRHFVDIRFGLIAAGLLLATPLFAIVITSAGFDALNHLLLLVLILAAARFARSPTPRGLDCLALLASLTAQCRYESIVFVAPLGLVVLARRREIATAGIGWRTVIAPLLLLPALLHRTILGTAGTEAGQPELAGHVVFSSEYVWPNLKHLAELFFAGGYPIARGVSILALCGLVMVLERACAADWRKQWLLPLAYPAIALLAIVLTYAAFRLGDVRTPFNMRLAVVFAGPLALLAAFPIHRLLRSRIGCAATIALTGALWLVYLPVARRNDVIGKLSLPREYARNLRVLAAQMPERAIIIAERPGLYVAQGWSSIGFDAARRRWPQGRMSELGHDVIAIQRVATGTGNATPSLPKATPFETIVEYPLNDQTRVRISRAD